MRKEINRVEYKKQWYVDHKIDIYERMRQYRHEHKIDYAKWRKQFHQIHPLYNTWRSMKTRCFNPKCAEYKNYGGRGISVHNEWLSFKPFEEWALKNGYQKGLTIDRIDNDGNYRPENCQFITRAENARKGRIGWILRNLIVKKGMVEFH